MYAYILLKTALNSIQKHKTRSLLTTLGIIIGVVSIISVMAIGEGAKTKVQEQIQDLGTNFIIVLSGEAKHKAMGASTQSLNLKKKDLKTIKLEAENVGKISPMIHTPVQTVYKNNNWNTLIAGANEHYLDIREWSLTKGRPFTKQDVASANKVALIGQTVAKELFDKQEPVGEIIRIKGLPFKVIGVLEEKGKMPNGLDQDDAILAPFETVQKKIMGVTGFAAMIISAKSPEAMEHVSRNVKSILRQTHRLKDTDNDDFTIFSQNDVSNAATTATKILNILLLIIASISLVVGGIGIMNIMLVSVTERTQEIGIRMALGATTNNILNQFILEAITICCVGGIVGLVFGITTAQIIGHILSWPVTFSMKPILLSIVSSTLVGLFFGYYPAYKASKLNPVEALADK